MAEFRQWRMEFESNDTGLVDRSHVPDPPGFDPSIGREVVSSKRIGSCMAAGDRR